MVLLSNSVGVKCKLIISNSGRLRHWSGRNERILYDPVIAWIIHGSPKGYRCSLFIVQWGRCPARKVGNTFKLKSLLNMICLGTHPYYLKVCAEPKALRLNPKDLEAGWASRSHPSGIRFWLDASCYCWRYPWKIYFSYLLKICARNLFEINVWKAKFTHAKIYV